MHSLAHFSGSTRKISKYHYASLIMWYGVLREALVLCNMCVVEVVEWIELLALSNLICQLTEKIFITSVTLQHIVFPSIVFPPLYTGQILCTTTYVVYICIYGIFTLFIVGHSRFYWLGRVCKGGLKNCLKIEIYYKLKADRIKWNQRWHFLHLATETSPKRSFSLYSV